MVLQRGRIMDRLESKRKAKAREILTAHFLHWDFGLYETAAIKNPDANELVEFVDMIDSYEP